ncbi:MAG: hypothetical protein ABI317_11150 [Gaiellales bacterium]
MAASTRIPHVITSLPTRWFAPTEPRSAPRAAQPVEEIWDAELVDDLPAPGWVPASALSTYGRAGYAMPAQLVDLRA